MLGGAPPNIEGKSPGNEVGSRKVRLVLIFGGEVKKSEQGVRSVSVSSETSTPSQGIRDGTRMVCNHRRPKPSRLEKAKN